jgi:hypothetical protein
MGMVLFIAGFVLFVAALLALDWFMAGRAGGRRIKAARDAELGSPSAGYAMIEQEPNHAEWNRGA